MRETDVDARAAAEVATDASAAPAAPAVRRAVGRSHLPYRPEIDGLRAVAVIPVIIFHLKEWLAPGGFLGVDVFFVISGFLITSIILREHDTGTFSFRRFWIRRVRRILPVLVTMIATTLALVLAFWFIGVRPVWGRQALAALFSASNVQMLWATKGYWGAGLESAPYLHTWSLGVEEQFYLLFPAIMLALLQLRSTSARVAALAAMTVVSYGAFLLGSVRFPDATFFLLPTRGWELGVGCLLAVVMHGRTPPRLGAGAASNPALLGLAMIVASYFVVPRNTGVHWWFACPVAGAALVIAFGHAGLVRALLSLRPAVFVGKISYSLYVWHWPAVIFAEHTNLRRPWILAAAITAVVSPLSYWLIERPARSHPRSLPVIGAGFLIAVALAAGATFAPSHYDASAFNRAVWHGEAFDSRPRHPETDITRRLFYDVIKPPGPAPDPEAYKRGGFVVRYGAHETPDVVLLGDSHAAMWAGTIDKIARDNGLTAAFSYMAGVPAFVQPPPISRTQVVNEITPEEKYVYDVTRLERIQAWKPAVVVLVARWDLHTVAEARYFVSFLAQHAGRVLLVEQPPVLRIPDVNATQYFCFLKMSPSDGLRQYLPATDAKPASLRVRELAAAFPNVQVVPIDDRLISPDGRAWVLDGRDVLYIDDDHLSEAGASKFRDRLQAHILAPIAGRNGEGRE